MATTSSSIDNFLRNNYLKKFVKEQNAAHNLYGYLKKNVQSQFINTPGRQFVVPIISAFGDGIGSRSGASATLPTAVESTAKQATYTLSQWYARQQVDWYADALADGDFSEYKDATALEMKMLELQFDHDINRILFGRGTGVLAAVTASSTGTTITVDTTKNLRAGMRVDVRVATSGSATGGLDSGTISSVTNSTTAVLSSAATTAGTTYRVYREDSRNADAFGIDCIADDADPSTGTSLGGLARASNTFWNASVLGNSGTTRDLTEPLLQQGFDEVAINGIGAPNLIVSNHAIARKYGYLLIGDRRFSVDSGKEQKKYNGGWGKLAFNGVDWLTDKHSPDNLVYGLNTDFIEIRHSKSGIHWFEEDGKIVSRVANTAASEATLCYFWQVVALAGNCHFRIEDVKQS